MAAKERMLLLTHCLERRERKPARGLCLRAELGVFVRSNSAPFCAAFTKNAEPAGEGVRFSGGRPRLSVRDFRMILSVETLRAYAVGGITCGHQFFINALAK